MVLKNVPTDIPRAVTLLVLGTLPGCAAGGSSVMPSVSNAPLWGAGAIFLLGLFAIIIGTRSWIARVDHHALLRTDEKLQNKDAVVIASFFLILLHLGLCIAGAAAAMAHPDRAGAAVLLAVVWALAAGSVGASFGFLLGHPRRLAEEIIVKDGRSGSNWLLRTGLDDIVDWLVKGITTVLLVNSQQLLGQLNPVAQSLTAGLLGLPSGQVNDTQLALAQGLIVFFTVFGALSGCLITRTYLTGALTRADRSTTGAFSRVGLDWGEVLALLGAQRSLGSRSGRLSPESLNVAKRLAQLSINDLRTPQEFALWAKAKSATGLTQVEREEALVGYGNAVLQCDCDPALLLDYSVALHTAGHPGLALERLEQAYRHISAATPEETVKNIYKSYTFQLLYEPGSFDRVIDLLTEYSERRTALCSGGLLVNEACAWSQRFRWLALEADLLETASDQTLKKPIRVTKARAEWPQDMQVAFDRALKAVLGAIARNPDWKRQLRFLLQSAPPKQGASAHEDDLEVFERFDEFRLPLNLIPWEKAEAQRAAGNAPPPEPPPERPRAEEGAAPNVEVDESGSGTAGTPPPIGS